MISLLAASLLVLSGSPPAAAATYLVDEGAEGTGTPAGWTDSGSPDWDYTTTILEGTQSMSFANGGWSATYTVAPQAALYTYCLVRAVITNDPYVIRIRTSADVQNGAVRFLADGRIRVYSDGGDFTDSASGTVSSGTTYSLWFDQIKGTGANSISRVYISTTTTKPGSPTVEYTTGDITADSDWVQFAPGSADLCIWDHIRASATVIGSAPP